MIRTTVLVAAFVTLFTAPTMGLATEMAAPEVTANSGAGAVQQEHSGVETPQDPSGMFEIEYLQMRKYTCGELMQRSRESNQRGEVEKAARYLRSYALLNCNSRIPQVTDLEGFAHRHIALALAAPAFSAAISSGSLDPGFGGHFSFLFAGRLNTKIALGLQVSVSTLRQNNAPGSQLHVQAGPALNIQNWALSLGVSTEPSAASNPTGIVANLTNYYQLGRHEHFGVFWGLSVASYFSRTALLAQIPFGFSFGQH